MPQQFRILIVGGGISGCSAAIGLQRKGHTVTLLERHPSCQSIGGPIFLGPNGTRVLFRYGMQEKIEGRNVLTDRFLEILRFSDGELLMSYTPDSGQKIFGYRSLHLARFHLLEILTEFALECGVNIEFNARVAKVDSSVPAVFLEDGRELNADLIIGADGVNSSVRSSVLPNHSVSYGPADSVYNIRVPRSFLRKDPNLVPLLNKLTFWYGPGRLVVAANLPAHGDSMDLSMACVEQGGSIGDWHQHGDLDRVRTTFKDFDPRVAKILEGADPNDCYIWRVTDILPLPTWVSESGKVTLLGDSVHAIVPASGSGAGLCVEDGACLAECLARAKSLSDLPKLLRAYETIRKPRTQYCRESARAELGISRLPDGEQQRNRDAMYKNMRGGLAWDGKHMDDPPKVMWGPEALLYVRGHDVFDYTNRMLDKILGDSSETQE